jgi:hypothetical protein
MLLLSALHATGWFPIDLPRWLLAAAYACLGWHIGLGFRRDALIHAGRAMPVVVAAALSLMGFCAALAWCLTRFAQTDPLTAYLANEPRRLGLDRHHCKLDATGGSSVRAGAAVRAPGMRDRLGAADHALCRQTLAASA